MYIYKKRKTQFEFIDFEDDEDSTGFFQEHFLYIFIM